MNDNFNKYIDTRNPFEKNIGNGVQELIQKYKQQGLQNKIDEYRKLGIDFTVTKDEYGNILKVESGSSILDTEVEEYTDNITLVDLSGAEVWHNTAIKETTELPMPTHCLSDKKYCAKEYAGLMTISNRGLYENHRYLYKNKFNTEELAKSLGISRTTLERNIKKLEKLEYNILDIENSQQGVIYKLHYGAIKEDGSINKFVTINHQMLKELACSFNNNAIKIYCLLKYMTNETEYKILTEEWICNQIGLNGASEKNQTTVRTLIKTLEKCKFIETKKLNIFKWDEVRKKEVPQITKQYRLCTFEEWKTLDKKVD